MLLDESQAKKLSWQLRQGSGDFLKQRRSMVGLSLVAIGSMGMITLYQMGLIKHLPEPPLSGMDADKVDAAPQAYAYLSTPDAVLGLGSYAVTLGLAAMGGPQRAREQPWIPLALSGKVGMDALVAGKLTFDQLSKHRAFCFWCLLAAGATFAMIPLVLGEARTAFRQFSGK
jgi:hypothetical protein